MNVEDMMYNNLSLDSLKYSSIPVGIIYPIVFHSKNGKNYILDNISSVLGNNVLVKGKIEDFVDVYNKAYQLAKEKRFENFYVCIPEEDFENIKSFVYNEYYYNKDFPQNLSVIKACDKFEGSEFSNNNNDFDKLLASEQKERENPSEYRLLHERLKAYIVAVKEDRLTEEDLQHMAKDLEEEETQGQHVSYSGYSYLIYQLRTELLRKREKYENVLMTYFRLNKSTIDNWIDPDKKVPSINL